MAAVTPQHQVVANVQKHDAQSVTGTDMTDHVVRATQGVREGFVFWLTASQASEYPFPRNPIFFKLDGAFDGS